MAAEHSDDLQTLAGRVERLQRLIEVTRALNSTLSLRPLLEKVVTTAQELTGCEAASIMLVDRSGGQFYFEATRDGLGYRARSVSIPLEGSVVGRVAQTGQPLVQQQRPSGSRQRRSEGTRGEMHECTLLAVPLSVRGQTIGVLQAVGKHGGDGFSTEDVELMAALGDQAAVAVQNALLFQQSDLIAEFVHEMRTPLTAIISYADLQQRADVPPEQARQFAGVVAAEATRLNQMANQFLELARLESGRAHMAREPVDVATLVALAVNVILPQADAAQIGVEVDVPPGLPPIAGDAQRLHQVMLNLLENAIKYSAAGDRVTVRAQATGRTVTISVSDTGPGIPPEALPHLFERFYRARAEDSRVPGVGLGLAITRQIVEAHRGRIAVESGVRQGTTVSFSIPIYEKEPAE
jgi:signal transduction histidine kinase